MKIRAIQYDPETRAETWRNEFETCQTPAQIARGTFCNVPGANSVLDDMLGHESWILDVRRRELAHYHRVIA